MVWKTKNDNVSERLCVCVCVRVRVRVLLWWMCLKGNGRVCEREIVTSISSPSIYWLYSRHKQPMYIKWQWWGTSHVWHMCCTSAFVVGSRVQAPVESHCSPFAVDCQTLSRAVSLRCGGASQLVSSHHIMSSAFVPTCAIQPECLPIQFCYSYYYDDWTNR